MSQGALPGFRDFYPEQLATRNYLMSVWRDVARKYGFVEYDGPPLEPLELYTRKSGEEIVGQLYNFKDKGLDAQSEPDLDRALTAAKKVRGTLLVTGSFHTVGDVMSRLHVSPFAA